MKEVIWNEDLISKLNELLSDSNNSISEDSFNAPEMPASDEAFSQNGEEGKKTGHSTSRVHLAFTEQAKLFREHIGEGYFKRLAEKGVPKEKNFFILLYGTRNIRFSIIFLKNFLCSIWITAESKIPVRLQKEN